MLILNFKSGLTKNLLANGLNIQTKNLELKLLKNKGIDANFISNKPVGFSIEQALRILDYLKEKTSSSLFIPVVPRIRAY